MTLGLTVCILSMLQLPSGAVPDGRIVIKDGLAINGLTRGGRIPLAIDPIQSAIARGIKISPKADEVVQLANNRTAKWKAVWANKDGAIPGEAIAGGYLYATVDSPKERVMLLEAIGNGMAYVNGEPHAGDPYGYGYLRFPVQLHEGTNRLLVSGGRGDIKVSLIPTGGVTLDAADATLPDAIKGYNDIYLGGVTVINATNKTIEDFSFVANVAGKVITTKPIRSVPPMSCRKVMFTFKVPEDFSESTAPIKVSLVEKGRTRASSTIELSTRCVEPTETHKETFVSMIDGSVQYYGVNPSQKPSATNTLILSTHGASVEGIGQAQAYAHKDWATLVAPTNRRPYGFDWEDWGRLDALEVLAIAKKVYPHDPQRVVLTGHSMGGHGTWHLGVTYPDLFAAIGPSAGWSSFFSYGGSSRITSQNDVARIMARAMSPSDTLKLTRNTLLEAVYILHGDKDDNVPVTEARMMRYNLQKFHPNVQYFEQPGAGHWWGTEQGPGFGSACVDWKPMMELFQTVKIPLDKDVKEIDFTTANPGVSAKCHWVTIDQQIHPLEFSNVKLRFEGGRVEGTTENVAAFSLDLKSLGGLPKTIKLNGQEVKAPVRQGRQLVSLTLMLKDGVWKVGQISVGDKSAKRTGPFKLAFQKRMAFIYGTKGSQDENRWAFAKARFDAEQWQYRGNGAVDVLPDTTDLKSLKGRNLILYGNRKSNAAWSKALAGCPVSVDSSGITVGKRTLKGETLGCVFVYPRKGTTGNLVGVVSGTGLAGMRSVERLSVFSAGVAYPDWMVIGVDALEKGMAGIRGAGFFGNDWKVESGDSGWNVTSSTGR